MKTTITLILLALVAANAFAQDPAASLRSGAVNPAHCKPRGNNVFWNTTTGTQYNCDAVDNWKALGGGVSLAVANTWTAPQTITSTATADGSYGLKVTQAAVDGNSFAGWFVNTGTEATNYGVISSPIPAADSDAEKENFT